MVSGTASYRMPTRSVGGALRDVVWVDSGGTPQLPPLRQLSSDEPEAIMAQEGTPYAYYLRNYHVVLVPTPNVSGTLRMPYYARPNRLVPVASAAPILTVEALPTGVRVTVASTATSLSFVSAERLDVVRATPAFETCVVNSPNVNPDNPGGGDPITFDFTQEGDTAEVGDYLCLPGESPVPQVPVELHGLLAARTSRRLLKAVGDPDWQALDADVADLELRARSVLTPRVSGDTQQAGGSMGTNGLVAGMGVGFPEG